jgi:hypothetical protein
MHDLLMIFFITIFIVVVFFVIPDTPVSSGTFADIVIKPNIFMRMVFVCVFAVLPTVALLKLLSVSSRLLKFKNFEQYEKRTQDQIEDLRNYILKNQQQP